MNIKLNALKKTVLPHKYTGIVAGCFFLLLFVLGNLKDSVLYKAYFPVTKYFFQTLGFEQRWGMYGYDYSNATYTRYLYHFTNETSETVYPRYFQQSEFNPFRYVKTEDFQWYYQNTKSNNDLMMALLKYFCAHPESQFRSVVQSIEFQVAHGPFPNFEEKESIYSIDRINPDYSTVLEIKCK